MTVSLPTEVRQAAQRVAEQTGLSFSAIVNDAVESWLRTRLVDGWLADHEAAHGEFDEAELRSLAKETGMTYLPPRNRAPAA